MNIERELTLVFIKNNISLSRKELYEKLCKEVGYVNPNTYKGWLRVAGYPMKKRVKSPEIDNYIKLHHRQTDKWLYEHIKIKFNVEIPLGTLRDWKSRLKSNTNRAAIRKDWERYIRLHYLKYSDKELAERLINKFQRPITACTVKRIRLKFHLYHPVRKHYRTVKAVRKCLNCGKDIKITCDNPNQKFCCKICLGEYNRKKTHKRNMADLDNKRVEEFLFEWTDFSKKVLYDNKGSLDWLDVEDVYSDYMMQIPSILYWIKQHGYTHKQHIKGYIAQTMKNCIRRKLKKRIVEQAELSIDLYNEEKERI